MDLWTCCIRPYDYYLIFDPMRNDGRLGNYSGKFSSSAFFFASIRDRLAWLGIFSQITVGAGSPLAIWITLVFFSRKEHRIPKERQHGTPREKNWTSGSQKPTTFWVRTPSASAHATQHSAMWMVALSVVSLVSQGLCWEPPAGSGIICQIENSKWWFERFLLYPFCLEEMIQFASTFQLRVKATT